MSSKPERPPASVWRPSTGPGFAIDTAKCTDYKIRTVRQYFKITKILTETWPTPYFSFASSYVEGILQIRDLADDKVLESDTVSFITSTWFWGMVPKGRQFSLSVPVGKVIQAVRWIGEYADKIEKAHDWAQRGKKLQDRLDAIVGKLSDINTPFKPLEVHVPKPTGEVSVAEDDRWRAHKFAQDDKLRKIDKIDSFMGSGAIRPESVDLVGGKAESTQVVFKPGPGMSVVAAFNTSDFGIESLGLSVADIPGTWERRPIADRLNKTPRQEDEYLCWFTKDGDILVYHEGEIYKYSE
jgi:hypothetical protein